MDAYILSDAAHIARLKVDAAALEVTVQKSVEDVARVVRTSRVLIKESRELLVRLDRVR